MELLENFAPKSKKINVKKQLFRYAKNWYWFLLSLLFFYAIAWVYLRYSQPQYLTKAVLKFQATKNSGGKTALPDFNNLGMMGLSGDQEIQSETAVIVSKPILGNVVRNLHTDVSFYGLGKIKEVELYDEAPLTGKIISLAKPKQFGGATYTITKINNRSFQLSGGSLGKQNTFYFDQPFVLPFGTIQISEKPGMMMEQPLKVVFSNIANAVNKLEGAISVVVPEKKGLLMELSMVGSVPDKSERILDELVKQYNQDGIIDKNQEAQNTADFIDKRLQIITNDLTGIENEKESFKKNNQIADLEAQAQLSLQNASENTKQILSLATQLDMVNSIYQVSSSNNDQLLPSNMGLSSGLESVISQYNELVLTRNRTLKQATNANPAVIEMNKEIGQLKGLIRKNLGDARDNLQQSISTLNAQVSNSKSNISKFPSQEKMFRSIERQQNLKEALYLFLLQKREETSIALSVTAPKAKVVNPAYTVGKVKPNNRQTYLAALLAGLLIPLSFFYVKYALDTKVHHKSHLTDAVPNIPVLGEIPYHEKDASLITANDFSVYAESFRILTSNLKFLLKSKDIENGAVILLTSSVKGEGKTTISMNTAITLSSKNKVIIIGADIRNPQLQRFMSLKTRDGLTNYLISDDQTPKNFIQKSGLSPNLDVLLSGAIAPNPNDLLDMPKFGEMIQQLKKEYDYVVIDTAPVMLVSDTIHIIPHIDVLIYIARAGYTEIEMLEYTEEFRKTNHIKNMALVLNEVVPENSRYGNKYGYAYSYGSEKSNKKKFTNFIGK